MKVCFIYSDWPHEKTLDVYRKMTPGRSGKWKDMEAVTNPDEADFCVIIDNTKLNIPVNKRIYVSAHPIGYPGYYDPPEGTYFEKINYSDTSGFLEWWLKLNYDELMNLGYPPKVRNAICILSNARTQDYQIERIDYMNRYCEKYPGTIDLYGRMNPELFMKQDYKGELGKNDKDSYWFGKEIMMSYKYAVEFDAYCPNYFSERIADALLSWCTPVCSGGWGLEKYLPEKSFIYLNRDNIDQLNEIIRSPFHVENIGAIKEARLKILNELQLWPKVYNAIVNHSLHA